MASSAFGQPSGNLTERADYPAFRMIVTVEGNHIFLSQGGVPIIRDGTIIRSCGVGSGTSQQDKGCAKVGVESP